MNYTHWKAKYEDLMAKSLQQGFDLRKEIAQLKKREIELNGQLVAEEARMDWLCDNYKGHGGGDGHHISVFIPAESEDLRDMIDQAIEKEVKA